MSDTYTTTGGATDGEEKELAELQEKALKGDRQAARDQLHLMGVAFARTRLGVPHDASTGAPVEKKEGQS